MTTKASFVIKISTSLLYRLSTVILSKHRFDHIILQIKNHKWPRNNKIKPKPTVQRSSFSVRFYPIAAVLYIQAKIHFYHSSTSILYFLPSMPLLKLWKPLGKPHPPSKTALHSQTFPVKTNLASFSIPFTPLIELSLSSNCMHVCLTHKKVWGHTWCLL